MTRGAHPEGHDETTGAEKPEQKRAQRGLELLRPVVVAYLPEG